MCLDAGINLFDTANIYSGGESRRYSERLSPADETTYSLQRKSACLWETARRYRSLATPHNPPVRGKPQETRHRLHRPLPGPRVGQPHPAGGDTGGAGHPCEERQVRYVGSSNYSGWQLMKALGISEARVAALRQPADPLHAAGEGGRVRVGAARHRSGVPHPRVEPAGRWPAIW